MPIRNAFWSTNRGLDLHALKGGSSPSLISAHLAFELMDGSVRFAEQYLIDPAIPDDVTLVFRPLIKTTAAGVDVLRGAGVLIQQLTGVVTVEDPLPPLHLRNFILIADVTNTADGVQYLLLIRIHIHEALSQVWLTPSVLTIRPDGPDRPDETGYKFSVRAQFDDGTVGDLTENHGVTWGQAANVHANGKIFLTIFDSPGDTLTVTATLPAALGGGSADGRVTIAEPWEGTNTATIVPGGGWPGTINPDVVPNFLFIGDGFTTADVGTYEQIAVSIIQRFKTCGLTTPFDLLATSMNFWRSFVPSVERGISILCEVYTVDQGGERRGYMVPNAVRPPVGGAWSLENLVYAVGLPVLTDLPSNAARTNADITAEWSALFDPDPSPNVPNDLVNQWRRLGNRSLVDDKDTPLGFAYGSPPQVNNQTDDLFVDFHRNRLSRRRLNRFLATLKSDQGHDLSAVWAEAGAVRPNNYDFVFILSSVKWDRGHNSDGYIAMNVEDRRYLLGVSTVSTVPGRNAYQWEPPSLSNSISSLRSGRALHEIAHSYGLGDEYADQDDSFTGTAADLERYGNLQIESDAQAGGVLNGDEIKWNWFRARKGALVRELVVAAGADRWTVNLQIGHGLPFQVGDKVILRKRNYPRPLGKDPVETVTRAADGRITVLEIDDPRSRDHVTVVGAIDPDLTFGEGDVLYLPRLAHDSVRSETYPFAEMVAKNIKDFITTQAAPLTPVPCDPAESKKPVQDPILPGVSLPFCFSEKPRIVGLYHGGRRKPCGIFHPAGTCMMHGDKYDTLEFCAVCRYILVDLIDPFKHFQTDLKYDEFYPIR